MNERISGHNMYRALLLKIKHFGRGIGGRGKLTSSMFSDVSPASSI
jgi:hypothetical protein